MKRIILMTASITLGLLAASASAQVAERYKDSAPYKTYKNRHYGTWDTRRQAEKSNYNDDQIFYSIDVDPSWNPRPPAKAKPTQTFILRAPKNK